MPLLFQPDLDQPYVAGTTSFNITDTAGVDCGAIFGGFEPGDPMTQNGGQGTHRYVLWRVWDPHKMPLVDIGLNPSTATHLVLDPTLRRDMRYAQDWGCGGIVKLNLFSFRSTDPKALYRREPNIDVVTGGVTNDEYLEWFTDPSRAGMVLCAWGAHGELYRRGALVARRLRELGRELTVFGFCQNGEPRHTLYLPASARPQAWNYIAA